MSSIIIFLEQILSISDHNLMMEKGRHLEINRHQRICPKCNVIANEQHFLTECDSNSYLRFLDSINNEKNCKSSSFQVQKKLSYVLNPSKPI